MLYPSVCSYRHITCNYDNYQHRATYFYELAVARSASLLKHMLLTSVLTDRHQTLYNTTSKKLSVPEGCFHCVWGSKYRFCVPQNHGYESRMFADVPSTALQHEPPNTKETEEQGRSPEEAGGQAAPVPRQGLFRRNQLPKTDKPEPTHGTVTLDNRL